MSDLDFRDITIEDIKVTKTASDIIDKLWSLNRLGISPCWVFEGDDGLDHYQTCESLLDYLEMFGGKLIRLNPYNVELIDSSNISSGKFLIQLD